MSPQTLLSGARLRPRPQPHLHVSWLRQLVNFAGCLVLLPICQAFAVNTRYPATVDLLLSILLAEYCRFGNERRRIAYREAETQPHGKGDVEKHALKKALAERSESSPRCEAVAAVVGWREDPDLWTQCLESYKTARGCKFLLVGIDGLEEDDQEMVDIFEQVYPEQSAIIEMEEPLAEVANAIRAREIAARRKLGADIDQDEIAELAMQRCLAIARARVEEALGGLPLSGPDGIRRLLVKQRHLHKKGIMFTLFVFAIVIADVLGVEILWSSDSDSVVMNDSLEGTIDAMIGDKKVGGSSSSLIVVNKADSLVTRMASCVYWTELYLTRSIAGAMAASDCQSGPSAAFRLSAIRTVLVPWYNQTVMGQRMIINEDRHLTTLLLLRGWGILFVGDVVTQTDAPTTLARWLRQQIRWARASHVESLLHPRVYLRNHPLLFLSVLRREVAHMVVLVQCLLYLFTDISLLTFNMRDLGLRLLSIAVYNILRNPDRQSAGEILWVVPCLIFYNIAMPAVQVWGLLTLTADTWGSSMRSSSERAKKDSMRTRWFESGFFVVWMGFVGAMLAKWSASRLDMLPGQALFWESAAAAAFGLLSWKLAIYDA